MIINPKSAPQQRNADDLFTADDLIRSTNLNLLET